MTITKLEDAYDEIKTLKAKNVNLLRKLKGVRLARKRDTAVHERKFNIMEDLHYSEIKSILPSKVKATLDYQRYMLVFIRDMLIESGKITMMDWIGAEGKGNKSWRDVHE